MPYPLTDTQKNDVADRLKEYYDTAWADGIRSRMDIIAQKNMGVVTAYLDRAKDTYANLKRDSVDSFQTTFKADLKANVKFYLGNKNDVATVLVTIGEKVINKIADSFSVPLLSSVISYGAEQARAELHERATKEADTTLEAKTGIELDKLFTNDVQAKEYVEKSISQYKDIVKYIQLMPVTIANFEDAITFPRSVFKVQAAVSALNISLHAIEQYNRGMMSRLDATNQKTKEYIVKVGRDMPAAVDDVIQSAYAQGLARGTTDVGVNRYKAPAHNPPETTWPPLFKTPTKPGGASYLAAYIAHAMALGYHDAGNTGPILTRARR